MSPSSGSHSPPSDVVRLEEGVALPHRGRRQDLEGQALRRRHLRDVAELRHAVPGMGEPDAAARAVADRGVDLRRQRPVQPVAVGLQLHDVPGGREVRAVAGGMPGRAGGQLVPLDQRDIAPAEPRQVIQHAAADDPAADHHHPRMRLHGPPPASHYASRQAAGESADRISFGLRPRGGRAAPIGMLCGECALPAPDDTEAALCRLRRRISLRDGRIQRPAARWLGTPGERQRLQVSPDAGWRESTSSRLRDRPA